MVLIFEHSGAQATKTPSDVLVVRRHPSSPLEPYGTSSPYLAKVILKNVCVVLCVAYIYTCIHVYICVYTYVCGIAGLLIPLRHMKRTDSKPSGGYVYTIVVSLFRRIRGLDSFFWWIG